MKRQPAILKSAVIAILLFAIHEAAEAQIPSPFAEDERRQMEEMQKNSVLTRDSITIIDTTVIFDPDTYEETMTIVESKTSIWDYCQQYLGLQNPDRLLDGETITITNPNTYGKMKIRWNHQKSKIDTIQ